MKVAYISSIAYADLDLSFVYHLSLYADVTYFMLVGTSRKSTAIDLTDSSLNNGLTPANQISEIQHFSSFINLDKTYIVYSPSQRGWSLAAFKKNHYLFRFLKKEKFDIVHLTSAPSYASWEMYFLKTKLVLTVHDPIPHSSAKSKLTELCRKYAFKIINNIILLNQSQKAEFVKRYHLNDQKKILVSRLSVYSYLRLFENNKYSIEGDYILYFGNIVSYKGLDYLFPAMIDIHKERPNVKLVVAGGGKYYFNIDRYKQLDYFDIRNRFIPDDELASLIRNCKFVVVPYIDATQSGVVMSAFAFNKSCIVTKVGGLPEMVCDGRHGIVVAPRDSQALSQAMLSILDDESLRQKFEENIAEDYSKGHKSWKIIAEEIASFYNGIK